uniref:MMS19 nucleotide excision repair protein n=1 Tax=Crassostrea virginica TaxID=6565 RepID=A0A8B8ENZ5_CRAVI|nr:MMS19 nucleotide excision repair protein homolog [Crassostrea virginica]
MICRAVFKEVQVQTLSQTDRCTVYNIYSTLLSHKLPELQKMETDFVYGFIQSMDTEKDPRNLLIAFHCARTIILNFSLGPFVEEMFEVTSCYFPIDFTPPPNDEFQISREDLIRGLRGCLSACPEFGPLCVPLLLDKLQSDVQSAILDSLLTLADSAVVYGSKCVKEFQGPLYRCIKQEIFSPRSPELVSAAESALSAMGAALSPQPGLSTENSDVDVFIKEVMQDSKRHFVDEDLRLFGPSCRLLLALTQGSDHACCGVIHQTLPLLEDMYSKFTGANQRKQIIEMLVKFLCCSKRFDGGKASKVVRDLLPSSLKILMSSVSQSSVTLTSAAVEGLGQILSLPDALSSKDLETVCWCVVDLVLNSTDRKVRSSCVEPCKEIMKVYPQISSEILPKLVAKIDTDGDAILPFIAIFAVHKSVISRISEELLNKLQQESQAMSESALQTCLWITSCLNDISIYARENSDCILILSLETVPAVYKLCVSNAVSDNYSDVLSSSDVLQTLSAFIRNTAILLDSGTFGKLYSFVTKVYCEATIGDVKLQNPFAPLQTDAPPQQSCLMTLLTPVVCSCPKQFSIPDIEKYRDSLTDLSLRSNHDYTRSEAAKCLSGILNRASDDDDMAVYLQQRFDFYEKTLTFDSKATSCLQQCVWVTKALVMRGHREASKFVNILLRLLGNEDLGEQAAEGVRMVLTLYEDVLNPKMHANIRLLYKQRFFTENSSPIIEGFQTASINTKKNYLMAQSHCLQSLPQSVLLRELPQLFPLLVQSLLCDNIQLQQSTMETLCPMITDAPDIIVKHIDTVIPQLLKLTAYKPVMRVRTCALRCLLGLVSLPTPVILPYRPRVIKALEGVLDDKKRLVRLEAVKARNEWCLLGEPGGKS